MTSNHPLPKADHRFIDPEDEAPDILVWNEASMRAYAATVTADLRAEVERLRADAERWRFARTIFAADDINDAAARCSADHVPSEEGNSIADMTIDKLRGAASVAPAVPTIPNVLRGPFDPELNESIYAVARMMQQECATDPMFPSRGLANHAALAERIIRAVVPKYRVAAETPHLSPTAPEGSQ